MNELRKYTPTQFLYQLSKTYEGIFSIRKEQKQSMRIYLHSYVNMKKSINHLFHYQNILFKPPSKSLRRSVDYQIHS